MKPCVLLAGTADGLVTLRVGSDGRTETIGQGIQGNVVRGIAADPSDHSTIYVACGLRGWGLHVTRDGGRTFQQIGFEDKWVWDVAVDSHDPRRILAGTEPPMLYESLDGGATFREFPGIDDVSSRDRWTFFHAPFHAGHLHGIAIHPERPDRIIVGVEHGGLLLTTDGGSTWCDVMPGADLHRVAIDPEDPDRIYAGAGHGLFGSSDGGRNWKPFDGLRGRYVHGIEIDPRDVERMFVYVDSSSCPVYRTIDGGASWEKVGVGLPSSRPADPVRLHPDDPDTLFYAGDSQRGSHLYVSENGGEDWYLLDVELPKIWRLQTASSLA